MIEVGRILRQDFLQQNGFDPVDASCSMKKAYGMLQMMVKLNDQAAAFLRDGGTVDEVLQQPVIEKINRARYVPEDEFESYLGDVLGELDTAFSVAA